MTDLPPWCVIVNLESCNENQWKKWFALLDTNHIPGSYHITKSIDELSSTIRKMLSEGNRYFLLAGGDGTLHHCGNLLLHHAGDHSKEIILGILPFGTGNDWVRSFGISKGKIIESLKHRRVSPMNLLQIDFPDETKRYAFNMIGAGLDAAVVDTLNASVLNKVGSIKYPLGLMNALLKSHQWTGSIEVDNKEFYGDWLTIQAGFGKYCGGGMYVLPHAEENSPALLLMKPKSIGKLITSLPKLYNGKISQQPEATALHFSKLKISHSGKPIPIEADGEWLGHSPVIITPMYGLMQRLVSI